jgi:RNA polymerase sporulation-specific sigma factor
MSLYTYGVIKENEWIIFKLASRYTKYYSIEDLYQVGCIGIMKALKKFDKNSNTKFSSYAYKYVLGEMVEYIKCDRNIRVSEDYISIYKRYEEIKSLLLSKYEREAKFSEICAFMEITESEMLNIIESITFTKSLNSDEAMLNTLNTDEREEVDTRLLLEDGLNELNEFEKSLIDYRYYQDYTQSETAEALGVTQVKVSREEKLILRKMKNKIAA